MALDVMSSDPSIPAGIKPDGTRRKMLIIGSAALPVLDLDKLIQLAWINEFEPTAALTEGVRDSLIAALPGLNDRPVTHYDRARRAIDAEELYDGLTRKLIVATNPGKHVPAVPPFVTHQDSLKPVLTNWDHLYEATDYDVVILAPCTLDATNAVAENRIKNLPIAIANETTTISRRNMRNGLPHTPLIIVPTTNLAQIENVADDVQIMRNRGARVLVASGHEPRERSLAKFPFDYIMQAACEELGGKAIIPAEFETHPLLREWWEFSTRLDDLPHVSPDQIVIADLGPGLRPVGLEKPYWSPGTYL